MRYRCVHCDKELEVAEGQKPRCPTCMRVHGLTPISAPGASADGARSRALLFGVVALVALAAGTALWLSRRGPEARDTSAAGEREERQEAAPATLASELIAHGLEAKGLERSLATSPEVEAWAKTSAGGAQGALARAQAIVKAVRSRAEASAFVPWSLADVRPGEAPLPPDETLAVLQKDGGRKNLYPFEVAALAVAALRALDERAELVEVFAFPAEQKPLDASGRLGYYALGVRDGAALHVLDPFGGRSTPPADADRRALSDREALGAALAISAAHTLALDPTRALKAADAAVSLARSTPTTRSARAIALLANAGSDEAERELKAAAQLRNDGPRRHNLAVLYLALGDFESAQRELMAAIEKEPEFASARVTLAGLLLGAGDKDGARRELEHAERLDPLLSAIPMVWAQYYQVIGDDAQAIASAQRGVERQPEDPQPRMLLAQLYRAAGRTDEMRGEAQRVVQLVPPEQRERVRAVLEQMLGPEALQPAGTAAPSPALDADAPGQDGPSLQLGRPSSKGPSLLGGKEPPASGTLRPSEGAPKLRLQEPGTN